MEYTAQYEYACSLVKEYINVEERLGGTDTSVSVYGEFSPIRTLFTTDYSLIGTDSVRKSIEKNLDILSASGQRAAVLTRLRVTYIDICAALGFDFMDKLKKSVANGLADANGETDIKKRKKLLAITASFVNAHPIIVLLIIGSKEYSKRLLSRQLMIPNLDTRNTSQQ